DGSNPVQLTSGLIDSLPTLTPDNRWVIYTAASGAKPTLWKVSIDGGTPTQMSDHVTTMSVVSPDGKFIAYTFPESSDLSAPPNRLTLATFDGVKEVKTFEIPPTGTVSSLIQWSPDGKSILYTVTANNVTNIWSQPIDGGLPKQLTKFNDMLITAFAWSRDGKQLACTRGNLLRDAVLITDQK
ncbi:MAG TPA: hypothetical protein VGW58_12565, partial [Pyrinomonadaceae bacterium]|nr:hypothetical protein [Pyrinomonadaceae bacterium]